MSDCPFCTRYREGRYDDVEDGVMTFEPLNPVTPGHRLFVPVSHIMWPTSLIAYDVGKCVMYAVDWAYGHDVASFNIITSSGAPATQTVAHVHVHLVPRHEGDGLALPWT